MNKRSLAFAAALLAAAAAPVAPVAPVAPAAHAQLSNMLSGALGSGSGGGSGLGGLGGVPSVGAASPTNLAGLLQYCMQNNDLGQRHGGRQRPVHRAAIPAQQVHRLRRPARQ